MNRWTTAVWMMSLGLVAAVPGKADAQVSVSGGVQLYFEWGDRGWRSYEPAYHYGPRREVVYYEYQAPRPLRIPPGHMPPPGYCRRWYPGVPPGHQPPPEPCGRAFRGYAYDGAVIIGAPAYGDVYGRGAYYDDRGPGRVKYKAPKKAKKRGRGW